MRTFSLVEGTSDKFWHIDVDDKTVNVHYGRTGTAGQRSTKVFDTAAKADEFATKQIDSKVKKGYTEGAGSTEKLEAVAEKAPRAKAAATEKTESTDSSAATAKAAGSATGSATGSAATSNASSSLSAAAPEPAREPIDFGEDGLGLVIPPVIAAALPGGTFDADARDDRPFTPNDEATWMADHSVRTDDYWLHWTVDAFPFVGLPGKDRAAWWDGWDQARSRQGYQGLPNAQRNKAAREAVTAEPTGSDEQLGSSRSTDPFIQLASRLALRGPENVLVWCADADTDNVHDDYIGPIRAMVTLSEDQAAVLRAPIKDARQGNNAQSYEPYSRQQRLVRSALLNTPDEHLRLVTDALDAGDELDAIVVPLLWAIDGVDNRAAVMERAGTPVQSVSDARDLLWQVGVHAFPHIEKAVRNDDFAKHEAGQMVELVGRLVHGPAAVDFFLALALSSRFVGQARVWLLAHSSAVRTALSARSSLSAKERELVLGLAREANVATPGTYAPDNTEGPLAAVMADLDAEANMPTYGDGVAVPDWWDDAVAEEAKALVAEGKLKIPAAAPAFAQPGALPPASIDGVRLSPDMLESLVQSAVLGANDEALVARPLVAAARARMTTRERDTLALGLLNGFLGTGAKSPDRPWFMASGYIGADGFSLELAPKVREWPGESQHQRAVMGLDVLAATGTDTALGIISGIANKSKFKGVQKAANESLVKLAAALALTVDQLEDRVVPDGGLDEQGNRIFDFGPRQFRVSLTPAGKLSVRDLDADGKPTGKPRTALPAPNSKDDANLAAEAKADFTVLRKQAGDLAKIQTARLEKAMITGRVWSGADHKTFVVDHPILNSLVRPLVWVVTSGDDRFLVRVTEERDYLDLDDETRDVPADAEVRLAHPLALSADEISGWQAHLVDYDLVSPIEQLDRPTFSLPAGQKSDIKLADLPSGKINPGTLLSTLERNGWRRGNPADGGVVSFLSLPFEARGVAAVIDIEGGLWTGMIQESGDQKIVDCFVGPLEHVRQMWYTNDRDNTWLDWTTVDPLIVSEVRRALSLLEEKMQP